MARFRGKHYGKYRGKRKHHQEGGDYAGLSEVDWILIEKYLVEYRTRAFEVHRQSKRNHGNHHVKHQRRLQPYSDKPVVIDAHTFAPLTEDACRRPYLDLPTTLTPKQRRKIHSMCGYLDVYHCGAGTAEDARGSTDDATATKQPTHTRRIVISVFANGFDFVPDIEATNDVESFPSRRCRPWYYSAHDNINFAKNSQANADSLHPDQFKQRVHAIEIEKNQIHKFVRYPETSIRLTVDDIDMEALKATDLSSVPTPIGVPWMLVDSVAKLKQCINEIVHGIDNDGASKVSLNELSFDLEMHNHGSGSGGGSSKFPQKGGLRTCLIQMTANTVVKDYVIDPLAPNVWDAIPHYLGPLFSDPRIVKIGHGIGGMDTTSLHRDFGIVIVNAFDTFEASAVLLHGKKGGLGLAKLCKHYGLPCWQDYANLKSQFQCSDWRKRPLCDDALEYGRYDVRFLITIRQLLLRDLVNKDLLGGRYYDIYQSIDSMQGSDSITNARDCYTQQSRDSSAFDSFSDCTRSESDTTKNDNTSESDTNNGLGMVSDNNLTSVIKLIHASELPSFYHVMKAIEISQKRCLKLWDGDEGEDDPFQHASLIQMIKQSKKNEGLGRFWSDMHQILYIQLAEWRGRVAYTEGMHVSEVCTLDFLVHVAYRLPQNRREMRRHSYFLPVLLEDKRLPYYDELREIITSSEAFLSGQSSVSSANLSHEVIFYPEPKSFRRVALRVLVTSAVVGVVAMAVTRSRKR